MTLILNRRTLVRLQRYNNGILLIKPHNIDKFVDFDQLSLIYYICNNYLDVKCTKIAMNHAATNGNLGIVQFLHYNRTEGCTTKAMDWAAYYGNLNIVQFLHYNRNEGCTENAIDWASEYGHLDVIKFLHENRHEGCTDSALKNATYWCHFNVVKYLVKHTDTKVPNPAIIKSESYRDIIDYLKKHNRIQNYY
jgi:hypothetical protein